MGRFLNEILDPRSRPQAAPSELEHRGVKAHRLHRVHHALAVDAAAPKPATRCTNKKRILESRI